MWLLLAFLSATLLGFYDVFKKKSLKDNAVLPVLFLNTFFSSLIFLPFILISVYKPDLLGGTIFDVPVVGWEQHKYIIIKSFIVLSSWIFGYFGMKHLPLTIVGPINADKQAGEAAAKSEAAVQTAREIAQKEVEEAKARKVESSLKAEKIVPAEIARQEAILQANAIAEKITREAEARAKATLAQAEAEAKAIQLKLEAEAEGKKKSLLAEAEGFEAMVRAAESNPAIAIQYKMVDQWKEIAGEQVKAFEHMNLGNITVFDGGNGGTSNFLNTLVKTVAPSLGVLDKLPIGETVKGIINPESKTEEKPATKADGEKR